MKKIIFIFISLILFFYSSPVSAAEYDLGVNRVWFSTNEIIAGDTARIYAQVTNYGTHDINAFVSFWNSVSQIGLSQPISVRANGFADEVFVDFLIPNQQFNVRVTMQAASPRDDNPSNDEYLSSMFTPIFDDDRDGVPNASDNCPDAANQNQADADHDGIGDACDNDDDNDQISDQAETSQGTNPLNSDTDGDGVADLADVFPTDSQRFRVPPPAPTVAPQPREVIASEPNILNSDSTEQESETTSSEEPLAVNINTSKTTDTDTEVAPIPINQTNNQNTNQEISSDFEQRRFWDIRNQYIWAIVLILLLLASIFWAIDRITRRRKRDNSDDRNDEPNF